METTINGKTIRLERGDITKQAVDAIANAANSALRGGGGVDGAIHRAAGPALLAELGGFDGCPTGSAVATAAYNLNAKYVFHAVGPVWRGGDEGEREHLASAYETCMQLATERDVKTIAFPSISTGVYSFPLELAAPIALRTVRSFLQGETSVETAIFVLFDDDTLDAYADALEVLDSGP